MSGQRMEEIVALVRETRDDPDAFSAGLVRLARTDVEDALDELCDVRRTPPRSYSELEALGRRLASAAAVAAQHEGQS